MEKNISNFTENFMKKYDKNNDIGYIIEVDVEYPRSLHNFHNDLPFLPERMKIKNVISLFVICMIKTIINFKTRMKLWVDTKKSA